MPHPRRRWFHLLRDWLRRIRRKPESPGDPFADRLVPVRRGPKGRSGAAVADIDDSEDTLFPPRKG
jgi:hypothetical protein